MVHEDKGIDTFLFYERMLQGFSWSWDSQKEAYEQFSISLIDKDITQCFISNLNKISYINNRDLSHLLYEIIGRARRNLIHRIHLSSGFIWTYVRPKKGFVRALIFSTDILRFRFRWPPVACHLVQVYAHLIDAK